MKEYKQLGAYAIIIKDDQILLINKVGGPYDKKLDLPGGTIEFGERPEESLKREVKEETGLSVQEKQLLNIDSISFDWNYKESVIKVHHIAVFYKITKYSGTINNNIIIDNKNDDSLGAKFYKISDLKQEELSKIVQLVLKEYIYKE